MRRLPDPSALRRSSPVLRMGGRVIVVSLLMMVFAHADGASTPPTWSPATLTTLRHLAIQHHGRLKPFESFARETLDFLTGRPRWGPTDPVQTVLWILADPERWQKEPLIWVPFVPLRDALGLDPHTSHVSYADLIATRKLMRLLPAIVEKQQRDEKLSMLEAETMDCYERFATLNSLFEQDLRVVPPRSSADQVWLPIFEPTGYPQDRQTQLQRAWTSLMAAIRQPSSSALDEAAVHVAQQLQAANSSAYPARWRLRWEVFYNHSHPFQAASFAYALAGLMLLASFSRPGSRLRWAGDGSLWTGALIHGVGIVTRVVLGGRPPVSNFFETMLWLPFVAVMLAFVFDRIYRVRHVGLSAAILAAVTLGVANQLPLDSSISPVVAVLHSTLWLTVHVLTIVASYGALALAAVLAHLYGWHYLIRSDDDALLASLELFLYRAIQVGVVLLTSGIMLGAVWANASWGRYWGWDPKETWALITLLWFLAVLHGRFAEWLKGVGVALATIGGFFLLLMTYYGVSFYLVGLHSYAGDHAKPLPPMVIGVFVAELAFLGCVGWRVLTQRRVTSSTAPSP